VLRALAANHPLRHRNVRKYAAARFEFPIRAPLQNIPKDTIP
jgi:hypothetical protein